jgi:L-aspartate oxidase
MDGAVKTRRWLEVKNMLTVALMVTRAALERNNSVGAQYRSDFPAKGDGWMSHYEIVSGERGMTVYPS